MVNLCFYVTFRMDAQVTVGKTLGEAAKHRKCVYDRLDRLIGEPQAPGPLTIDLDRTVDPMECVHS
jgi:hypothetical protein